MADYIWKNILYQGQLKSIWESGSQFYNTYQLFYSDDTSKNEFTRWVMSIFNVCGMKLTYSGSESGTNIQVGDANSHYLSFINTGVFNIYTEDAIDAIKFKSSSGLSTKTLYKNINGCYIIAEGITWQQITLYFDDVGLGQSRTSTYLWNNKQLNDLNSETDPYLENVVEIVSGAAKDSNEQDFSNTGSLQVYSGVEKDYNSSVTGNSVSQETLNKIGVNKIVIPRYKISENNNEHHFECLSFPSNRVQMTNEEKENGQLCHDGDLQLASDKQVDALYWSTTPHIYPEVIFNTTKSLDATYTDVGGSHGYYSNLKEHQIKRNGNQITIDNSTYNLCANDRLLSYIRRQGQYESTTTPTSSNTYIVLNDESVNKKDQTGTSKLSFAPMEIYDITNINFSNTFNSSVNYSTLFTSGQKIKHDLFKSLIHETTKTVAMPTISGADWGLYEGSLFKGDDCFATLGDYSYEESWWGYIKSDTISNTSKLTYYMNCDLTNFSYIGSANETWNWTPYHKNYTTAHVDQPKRTYLALESGSTDFWSFDMQFITNTAWWVGTFPQTLGFFQDGYKDTSIKVAIDGLNYIYSSWDSSVFPDGMGGATMDTDGGSIKFTVGYNKSTYGNMSNDTFALAIVIWRNGKLVA